MAYEEQTKNLILFLTHNFNEVFLMTLRNINDKDKNKIVVLFDKTADMKKHYELLSETDKDMLNSFELIEGTRTEMPYDPQEVIVCIITFLRKIQNTFMTRTSFGYLRMMYFSQ